MEVDPSYMDLMKSVILHSRTNRDDLLQATGRAPGENPTQGDMHRLGLMFREKVIFSSGPLIIARQLDAENDATRRRNEVADHSDEYNDLYNKLYPLESCVPADNKHMGKQISTLAAKMREKKRLGRLTMDSPAD